MRTCKLIKVLRQKKTNEGRQDHLDVSLAFGDQTYKYRIRIALTFIVVYMVKYTPVTFFRQSWLTIK